jgi:hypothetical protein
MKLFVGTPVGAASEQDYRRFGLISQSQQSAEIGVCRQNGSVFLGGPGEDLLVFGRLHPIIPHVDRVVPVASQPFRHYGRERTINQESHGAASGSSRSLTASAAYCSAS